MLTKKIYVIYFTVWVCGFVLPFMIQILHDLQNEDEIFGSNKPQQVVLANIVCIITTVIFIYLEANQIMNESLYDYFSNMTNIIDLMVYVVYIPYGIIRMLQPH